ncbi:hypothetical protein TPHA_0N01610 [Tetrapisispora phaffii CBS 4417]|uniref:tRNA-splicing endonuclease subunit Sen15 domain-containing protein n=1 Tax=Tetrapisispora phaffii (strain ATCC 24235 / CBS 4417 / NBRC 1672 / NRRL Y-8282 / UCD 70-5) TaxID=1071381 RepID=G8C1B4_TETPH|nr:hypothetical protein TPHA_0N01610 [Tetrapisispora phaffii CBS 4417]CCE65942.1 hypothetical protein TPHA_0N01610 [Tetrapisispora phaffii CBS 4417]
MYGDETVQLVRNNLVHNLSWSDVEVLEKSTFDDGLALQVIRAQPSNEVSQDDAQDRNADGFEYIVPIEMSQHLASWLTVKMMEDIFVKMLPLGTKRFIMAVVSDDGTVMFYYVYEGVHKPRRN